MTTTAKLMTAEEFWRLPETDSQRSLVRGEVQDEMPVGGEHGIIAMRFGRFLGVWAEEQNAGVVGGESGFILARNPDIVRGPAVYFVRADRVPAEGIPKSFWSLAPDLAVVAVSPSETAQDVQEKIDDYLGAGTQLVRVAFPKSRTVVAHTRDDLARTFRETDILTAPDVLPGFSCLVARFFPKA